MLEGHATLGEVAGGIPDIEDVLLFNQALNAWQHAGRIAAKSPR